MSVHRDGMSTAAERTAQEELLDRYLTTTYASRNDLSAEGLQRAARNYAREFGPLLPDSRAAAILEVGCGVGGFLLCCRELGYTDVDGIDLSGEQVTFCHDHGFERVEQAEALDFLSRPGRRYAAVVLSDVLEHLPRHRVVATLEAINGRLEAGGKVILRVPNMSNPLNLRTRYVDFTHESGFTKESLAQLLRAAGFGIETVYGAFTPHRSWLARLVFDGLLWRAFLLFQRHTMHLKREVERGKNLIAVGVARDR